MICSTTQIEFSIQPFGAVKEGSGLHMEQKKGQVGYTYTKLNRLPE
jgi:hypothetical protein